MDHCLDHPFGALVGAGPVIICQIPSCYGDVIFATAINSGIMRQPDMGQFRVTKRHPWHCRFVDFSGVFEQYIAQANTGMIASHMGKLLAAGDIANGIDSFIAGAQSAISDNAGFAKFYIGSWQVQPVNDWPPTSSNQKMTRLYDCAIGKRQLDAIWLALANVDNGNAFDECDAV